MSNPEIEKLLTENRRIEDVIETISTFCFSLDAERLDQAWKFVYHLAQDQRQKKILEERVECLEMKLTAAVNVLEIVQRKMETLTAASIVESGD